MGKTDWKFFQSYKYFSEGIFVSTFVASELKKNIEESEMQHELQTGRAKISFLMRSLALSMSTETSSHGTIYTGGDELKPWQFCQGLADREGQWSASQFVQQSHIQGMAKSPKWAGTWASLCLRYPLESLHKKACSWYADVLIWKWASCLFPRIRL